MNKLSVCHFYLVATMLRVINGRTFTLGILLPFGRDAVSYKRSAEMIRVAENIIKSDRLLDDFLHDFRFLWSNTDCDEGTTLKELVTILRNEESLDVIIGPGCEVECMTSALLAGQLDIPIIGYSCRTAALSDKTRYPTFVRTSPSDDSMAPFLAKVLQFYNWNEVVIMTSHEDVWRQTAYVFQKELESKNIASLLIFIEVASPDKQNILESALNKVPSNFRVVVLCVNSMLGLDILQQADDMGMISDQFVFITIRWVNNILKVNAKYHMLQGILDISVRPNTRTNIENLFESENRKYTETENSVHLSNNMNYFIVDAILLYVSAAIDVSQAGVDSFNSSMLMPYLVNRSFSGAHGSVFIKPDGNAVADYTLSILQNNSYVSLLDYFTSSDTLISYNVSVVWPGGATSPPYYQSPSNGSTRLGTFQLYGVTGLLVVLVTITTTFGIVYRKRQKSRMLLSTQWKISFTDLDMTRKAHGSSQYGSNISRDLTLYDSISNGSNKINLSTVARQQLYTRIAFYQGHMVAVKEIRKKYIYVSNEVICEMNEVRNLQHTNLNKVIGACVDPNHICIVSEYCSKGSLQDVLENDNIRLDRIFNISFASDIAQGMAFLHNSVIQYHGSLKSSNVLIDSRWTCKLTDFGLRRFREGERKLLPTDPSYYYQLLWTAPEHLREDVSTRTGSQKGDVYSYAIVLQEIMTRSPPYCEYSQDPKFIIERVAKREQPVFRPKLLSSDQTEERLVDLMRMCWEEIPAFRPNFITIRDSLKKLTKGRRTNLVDQMMEMMEKYADQLEDLVDERTKQLADEQRKTEELLCRMLPRSVAEKLKRGLTVVPESYSSVTIFFSDIVGFTALAAASTPMQVVDFLNDLYTCFDAVTENYDVYKVETIGDAYMVVSGLPVSNGLRHAGEICTMSLDLLSAVRSFRISHMPDRQLQLRIGIHTGPVVAGVVGIKMPRYCLFGDTVNYASRMESSGLALRIHVSPECKAVLDQLGGYELEERGEVTMKGKGTIRTYFLLGKEGFDKKLPDLSKALPPEEHEFK